MKKVKKLWGEELWVENNKLYCGKIIICKDEIWSSEGKYHYHKKKDETFYILEGNLILDIEGKENFLIPGQKYRIIPGVRHRFKSYTRYCKFIEFSTQHLERDSYRIKNAKNKKLA